ncbi:hypothetical protein GUITHDRAFT_74817 [Guillardia theta CCMP2712]|uniref:Dynein light chain n=1 Tax=Guillardia theta (strain CCMP2712) TaxID=905079 RepID=L1IZW4_GUITC|nr:hypothetical protein GUITHDRAFT_74817 [Guillardia theta CCMP2712]EKX41360.1 hypothetical protein GUITHDRAFT_74817 [Guillardia theta CCMP2712]|eukprot:XP_005828340.1 hypothetical protein GUITHDRAFT_74817 [Guillardia theta CCMP2712]
MKDVMRERLKEEKYNVDRAAKATREIADSIKMKLKEFHWERYKYVVQVVIGEQRGEGIQMGCRCFWDEDADNFAQASYSNDSLFATAVAFGVYLY